MAKLVYLGEEGSVYSKRLDQLIAQYKLNRKNNVSEMAELRSTVASDVLVVTEPRLMRGFDYRAADKKGIALMLCLGFDTQRGYIQALGRVGRFGDSCRRFTLKSSTMVYEARQNELDSAIMFGL